MSDRVKNITFYIIISGLMILGIYLRILFFSYDRPFWNDESALALNIINRSFFGLFSTLDYEQVSPPLYIVIAKFFGLFIRKYEIAYRLPALICSILSIPVFFVFCKKFLEKKISIIFAMMLFIINYQLIYYGQELKQYGADILVFLLILLSYFYIDFEKNKIWMPALTGIVFAVSIWFSYAAVFGVFCIGCVMLIKNYKNWKQLLVLFLPFCLSLLVFWIFRHEISSSDYLHLFWAKGFIAKNFSNFFDIISDNLHFYFLNFAHKFFLYFLLLCGVISVLKNIKDKKYLLIIIPFVLACVLSYFNIYPLSDRVSIYLSSLWFVVLAKSFDLFNFSNKCKWICSFISLFLFLHIGLNCFWLIKSVIIDKGYYVERTPEFLKLAESKMHKDDFLYVAGMTHINYKMYKDTVNIKNVIVEKIPSESIEDYLSAFDGLKQGTTYYFLLTHSGDKILDFENLKKVMQFQQNVTIISDKNYNLLIKFTKS